MNKFIITDYTNPSCRIYEKEVLGSNGESQWIPFDNPQWTAIQFKVVPEQENVVGFYDCLLLEPDDEESLWELNNARVMLHPTLNDFYILTFESISIKAVI